MLGYSNGNVDWVVMVGVQLMLTSVFVQHTNALKTKIRNDLGQTLKIGTCYSDQQNQSDSEILISFPKLTSAVLDPNLSESINQLNYNISEEVDPSAPYSCSVYVTCKSPYPIEIIFEETLNPSFRNPYPIDVPAERIAHQDSKKNDKLLYLISLCFDLRHIVSAKRIQLQCSSVRNNCWGRHLAIEYWADNRTITSRFKDVVATTTRSNDSAKMVSASAVSNFGDTLKDEVNSSECKAFFYFQSDLFTGAQYDKNVTALRNSLACMFEDEKPGRIALIPVAYLSSIVRNSFQNIDVQPSTCWSVLDKRIGEAGRCANCTASTWHTTGSYVVMCVDPFQKKYQSQSMNTQTTIGGLLFLGQNLQVYPTFHIKPYFPGDEVELSDIIGILNSNDTSIVGATTKIACIFSVYYFSPPFTFTLEYGSNFDNISRFELQSTSETPPIFDYSFNALVFSNIVQVQSSLKRAYCSGFLKRQAEWINTSVDINVLVPTKPCFLSKSDIKNSLEAGSTICKENVNNTATKLQPTKEIDVQQIYFDINSENVSIECHSGGLPWPTFTWTLLNNTFKSYTYSKRLRQDDPSQFLYKWSTIRFSKVGAETEGDYICEAANQFGVSRKIFRVVVNRTKLPTYDYYTSYNFLEGPSFQATTYVATSAVVGVLLLVCGIILIMQLRQIRKQKGFIRNLTLEEVQVFRNGNQSMCPNDPQFDVFSQPFNEKFEIPKDCLVLGNQLGSGQFGTVTKALLLTKIDLTLEIAESQPLDDYINTGIPAAVKTIKSNVDVMHVKSLLSEIKIMAFLETHPNIVKLLGTVTANLQNDEIFLAVEYCANGDLRGYLNKYRTTFANLYKDVSVNDTSYSNLPLSEKTSGTSARVYSNSTSERDLESSLVNSSHSTIDLLKWSLDIANGMAYLSEKRIIHGDLAARNILLTDQNVAKISDFGLSRVLRNDYTIYAKKTETPLPWKWLAIESLKYQNFSVKSDVWSFGIVLWEIFSIGDSPYPGLYYNQDFVDTN